MVERIYATCVRHAGRCLPADPALEAEDLAQQAWLLVGGRLDALPTDGDRARVLCRTITNLAINHYRRLARHPRVTLVDVYFAADDPAGEALLAAELDAALTTPRLGLAEAVLHGLGYTYDEIAARVGVGRGTVCSRISRSRDRAGEE